MKDRPSRLSALAQELDLPEDIGRDGYHIEIFGGTLVLDGCKNIAEYGDGVIRLNTGRKIISVYGGGLIIKSFACGQVTLCGKILSVDLG